MCVGEMRMGGETQACVGSRHFRFKKLWCVYVGGHARGFVVPQRKSITRRRKQKYDRRRIERNMLWNVSF